METDQLAILIAGLSFGVAAFSLGWNIYKDIILKPTAKASADRVLMASEVMPQQMKLKISAVNHGPGPIRLNIIRFIKTSLWKRLFRKWTHGVIIHDYRNPLSGQLPVTLEVGETVDLIFPWDAENICSVNPTSIGIADSFGRTHWAKRKNVRKLMEHWRSDFAPNDS